MRYTISEHYEVNVGDYWRDRFNNRHIIDRATPTSITTINEVNSTPVNFSPDRFYKNFTLEARK